MFRIYRLARGAVVSYADYANISDFWNDHLDSTVESLDDLYITDTKGTLKRVLDITFGEKTNNKLSEPTT